VVIKGESVKARAFIEEITASLRSNKWPDNSGIGGQINRNMQAAAGVIGNTIITRTGNRNIKMMSGI
jgi:hypothetical protein